MPLVKGSATPLGDYNFGLKILLHSFLRRKAGACRIGLPTKPFAKEPHSPGRRKHKMKIDMQENKSIHEKMRANKRTIYRKLKNEKNALTPAQPPAIIIIVALYLRLLYRGR